MKNDELFKKIMKIGEDVSSIKTDIQNIKEQNKTIKEQNKRLDKLENQVSQHSNHFKLLSWVTSGVVAFIFLDVVAPLIVNFFSH